MAGDRSKKIFTVFMVVLVIVAAFVTYILVFGDNEKLGKATLNINYGQYNRVTGLDDENVDTIIVAKSFSVGEIVRLSELAGYGAINHEAARPGFNFDYYYYLDESGTECVFERNYFNILQDMTVYAKYTPKFINISIYEYIQNGEWVDDPESFINVLPESSEEYEMCGYSESENGYSYIDNTGKARRIVIGQNYLPTREEYEMATIDGKTKYQYSYIDGWIGRYGERIVQTVYEDGEYYLTLTPEDIKLSANFIDYDIKIQIQDDQTLESGTSFANDNQNQRLTCGSALYTQTDQIIDDQTGVDNYIYTNNNLFEAPTPRNPLKNTVNLADALNVGLSGAQIDFNTKTTMRLDLNELLGTTNFNDEEITKYLVGWYYYVPDPNNVDDFIRIEIKFNNYESNYENLKDNIKYTNFSINQLNLAYNMCQKIETQTETYYVLKLYPIWENMRTKITYVIENRISGSNSQETIESTMPIYSKVDEFRAEEDVFANNGRYYFAGWTREDISFDVNLGEEGAIRENPSDSTTLVFKDKNNNALILLDANTILHAKWAVKVEIINEEKETVDSNFVEIGAFENANKNFEIFQELDLENRDYVSETYYTIGDYIQNGWAKTSGGYNIINGDTPKNATQTKYKIDVTIDNFNFSTGGTLTFYALTIGGIGTQGNPFRIKDANDWNNAVVTYGGNNDPRYYFAQLNDFSNNLTPNSIIENFKGVYFAASEVEEIVEGEVRITYIDYVNPDGENKLIIKINITSALIENLYGSIKNIKIQNINTSTDASFAKIMKSGSTLINCASEISHNILVNNSLIDELIFGGLVNKMESDTIMENCYTNGDVKIEFAGAVGKNIIVGGLVGIAKSGAIIKFSYFIGSGIVAEYNSTYTGGNAIYIGGIIGKSEGVILNTTSDNYIYFGSVEGNCEINVGKNTCADNFYVGGIIGWESCGEVNREYLINNAKITVKTTNNSNSTTKACVGGIIGYASVEKGSYKYLENRKQILFINNVSNVNSENFCTSYIGGIVGNLNLITDDLLMVENCLNNGDIKIHDEAIITAKYYLGKSKVGGLIGNCSGSYNGFIKIIDSFAECNIDVKNSDVITGGFVGNSQTNLWITTELSDSYYSGNIYLYVKETLNSEDGNCIAGGIVGQAENYIVLDGVKTNGTVTLNGASTRIFTSIAGLIGYSLKNNENITSYDNLVDISGELTEEIVLNSIYSTVLYNSKSDMDVVLIEDKSAITETYAYLSGAMGYASGNVYVFNTLVGSIAVDGVTISHTSNSNNTRWITFGGIVAYVKNLRIEYGGEENTNYVQIDIKSAASYYNRFTGNIGGLAGTIAGVGIISNARKIGAITTNSHSGEDYQNVGGIIGTAVLLKLNNVQVEGGITLNSTYTDLNQLRNTGGLVGSVTQSFSISDCTAGSETDTENIIFSGLFSNSGRYNYINRIGGLVGNAEISSLDNFSFENNKNYYNLSFIKMGNIICMGGLIGSLTANEFSTSSEGNNINYGDLILGNEYTLVKSIFAGGIIGNFEVLNGNKETIFNNLKNYGAITLNYSILATVVAEASVPSLGGIIGAITTSQTASINNKIKLVSCMNLDKINESSAEKKISVSAGYNAESVKYCIFVGGLVGNIDTSIQVQIGTADDSCISCKNSMAIEIPINSGGRKIFAGGIVGNANTKNSNIKDLMLFNCENTGNIIANMRNSANLLFVCGGLVGRSTNIFIVNSNNKGQLSDIKTSSAASAFMGGLVGFAISNISIQNSHATNNFVFSDSVNSNVEAGGLLGKGLNSVLIEDCYYNPESLTTLYNNITYGGLVGSVLAIYIYGVKIYYSYANSNVDGALKSNSVGGLIGIAITNDLNTIVNGSLNGMTDNFTNMKVHLVNAYWNNFNSAIGNTSGITDNKISDFTNANTSLTDKLCLSSLSGYSIWNTADSESAPTLNLISGEHGAFITSEIFNEVDGETADSYKKVTFSGSKNTHNQTLLGWAISDSGNYDEIYYMAWEKFVITKDLSLHAIYIQDTTNVGDGTEENPYQINTVKDFNGIVVPNAKNENIHYIQTANFEFNTTSIQVFNFAGNYNGNNYTITLKSTNLAAVFSPFYEISGKVYGLKIDMDSSNNNIKTQNYYLSDGSFKSCVSVMCVVLNGGQISNCSIADDINIKSSTGIENVAGFVAYLNTGEINDCTLSSKFTVTINSKKTIDNMGGFAGYMTSGKIDNCTINNFGIVSKSTSLKIANMGGFVGCLNSGEISNCAMNGDFEIETDFTYVSNDDLLKVVNVGGFVGYVEKCNYSYNGLNITGNEGNGSQFYFLTDYFYNNNNTDREYNSEILNSKITFDSIGVSYYALITNLSTIVANNMGNLKIANAKIILNSANCGATVSDTFGYVLALSGNDIIKDENFVYIDNCIVESTHTQTILTKNNNNIIHAGAIVGKARFSFISNCKNNCDFMCYISNDSSVRPSDFGGIAGDLGDRSITTGDFINGSIVINCENNGIINLNQIGNNTCYSSIGGIVGFAVTTVFINVINRGDIKCESSSNIVENVGGIVGETQYHVAMYNCVNYGNINFDNKGNPVNTGGIVGKLGSLACTRFYFYILNQCINYGEIIINNKRSDNDITVGGVIGTVVQIKSDNVEGEYRKVLDFSNRKQVYIEKSYNMGKIQVGYTGSKKLSVGGIIAKFENTEINNWNKVHSKNSLELKYVFNKSEINVTSNGTKYVGELVGYITVADLLFSYCATFSALPVIAYYSNLSDGQGNINATILENGKYVEHFVCVPSTGNVGIYESTKIPNGATKMNYNSASSATDPEASYNSLMCTRLIKFENCNFDNKQINNNTTGIYSYYSSSVNLYSGVISSIYGGVKIKTINNSNSSLTEVWDEDYWDWDVLDAPRYKLENRAFIYCDIADYYRTRNEHGELVQQTSYFIPFYLAGKYYVEKTPDDYSIKREDDQDCPTAFSYNENKYILSSYSNMWED